jgi:hypothetical protein
MKHIRLNITLFAAILLLAGFSCRATAQQVRGRSERLRPTRIHTGNLKKINESFDYIVATNRGRSPESLKSRRKTSLFAYPEQTNGISGIITKDVNSVHINAPIIFKL